jgi:hypothetical protein
MLVVLTIILMLFVGYSFWNEGVSTAFCMLINVFVAGLVAFFLWEPLAEVLEPMLTNTFLQGYEDFICLMALAAGTLAGLRWATNQLCNTIIDHHSLVQGMGAAACGLLAGYLLAGFLVCAWQTLPWHENFMGFDAKVDYDAPNGTLRPYLPPDRVWLALMNWAGQYPFSQTDWKTFDPNGTFELRYLRHRRYNDKREAMPYHKEAPPF